MTRQEDLDYVDPEDHDAVTLGLFDETESGKARPSASLTEWIAAAFGATGSLLLAVAFHPAWGFAAFAVSNVGWIVFSLRRQLRALLAQQIVFSLTTVIGLWNWWLGPLLLG